MVYEYKIELVPMPPLSQGSEAGAADTNLVYACGEQGECEVRDMRMEQIEYVQDFLNEMGRARWELVQISMNKAGAVTFWKRAVPETGDASN
jgi:hypothetical protein